MEEKLTVQELITVLKQVSSFDAGEPYAIECYGNQFLLQKSDIDELLAYIEELEEKVKEV